MKKGIVVIAIASIILNIGLIYFFVIRGEVVKIEDSRQVIKMSEANKDFVLTEMRSFLESVQQINEGIINNDSIQISTAAKKAGNEVVDIVPKGLIGKLPLAFKQMGFATHDDFDAIAKSATNNFNESNTRNQLNLLLKKCVACHKTYKIETNFNLE